MTDKPIYAWHFSDGFLRYDMSDVEIRAGLTLETDAEPQVEKEGFHACRGAHDALFNLSSNPIDDILVSRVKLSGKLVTADYGYEIIAAQKREHLWIADANQTVENFALWYIEETLKRLEKANVIFSDILRWAIENRRLLFGQELPKDKLYEIAEYVNLALPEPQKSARKKFPEPDPDTDEIEAEDWLEFLAPSTSHQLLAIRVHIVVGRIIRYPKLNFAAEVVPSFAKFVKEIIAITAAKAYLQHERDAILQHLSGHKWGVALPSIPATPAKYLEQMRKQYAMPDANHKLHSMLMQLAPAGYTEP